MLVKVKNYACRLLKRRKTNIIKERYQIPKHVLEGSVIAERFFSDVKYFLNKYRKLTLPIHIEESLMLRYNIKYWSMETVAAVLAKGDAFIEATEIVDDEEEED